MTLVFLLTCFSFSRILEVSGKKEAYPRFLIEDALRPPIFGSHSYDPIKQVFEIEQLDDLPLNITTHSQDASVSQLSTKALRFVKNRPTFARLHSFRKFISDTDHSSSMESHLKNRVDRRRTKPKFMYKKTSQHKNKKQD